MHDQANVEGILVRLGHPLYFLRYRLSASICGAGHINPIPFRPVPADDDVIVHRDPERLCDLRDLPRHIDVGARRSRIAGGMLCTSMRLSLQTLVSEVFDGEAKVAQKSKQDE